MNPVSEDVKDVLVTESVGTFPASSATGSEWGISVGHETDSPDTMITLYDTPGGSTGLVMDKTVVPTERPMFQVRVRCFGYKTGYTKLQAIMDLFDNSYRSWSVTGARYLGVFRSGNPVHIGQDDKGRDLWVVNYRVVREEV